MIAFGDRFTAVWWVGFAFRIMLRLFQVLFWFYAVLIVLVQVKIRHRSVLVRKLLLIGMNCFHNLRLAHFLEVKLHIKLFGNLHVSFCLTLEILGLLFLLSLILEIFSVLILCLWNWSNLGIIWIIELLFFCLR